MANATSAAGAAATTNAQFSDYSLEATIIRVSRVVEGGDERVAFELDKEFDSFDFKTEELIKTSRFSLAVAEASRQLVPLVDEFTLADAYMLGGNIPVTLMSLVLKNAKVKVNRVFKAKGEQREQSTDTYRQNLYKSIFEEVKTDIKPIFEPAIAKELEKISNFEVMERQQKRQEDRLNNVRGLVFGW